MPRILISYRQADTQHITGRIFDRLALHYGRGSIFRDIDSIRPGIDFRDQISEALAETDVLLAIVGPKWLGRRGWRARINDESDMVRIEVETAIETRIPIIPVLIDGTKMPDPGQLPASLTQFVFRHAVTVDSGVDFDNHIDRLRREIDRILASESKVPDVSAPRIESGADPGPIADPTTVSSPVERGTAEESEAATALGIASSLKDASAPQVESRPDLGPITDLAIQSEMGIASNVQEASAPKVEDHAARAQIVGGTTQSAVVVQETAETSERARNGVPRFDGTSHEQNSGKEIAELPSRVPSTSGRAPSIRGGHILIVDDNETNRDILATRLATHGFEIFHAADGEEALAAAKALLPDLILLDVVMPKIDGIEVCRRLKSDSALPFMPIILVTARADIKDVVIGFEAGADEYLTKPIDPSALIARVNAALRTKKLHEQVLAQGADLVAYNRLLEERVAQQLGEIDRMKALERFLSPQIAELVLSSGRENVLESHRSNITVLFCDLRGFTAFAEIAAPEEVMALLAEYHTALGASVNKHEGTVGRFTGDTIMVLFNDPLPCPDPSMRAVRMAMEMRDSASALGEKWRKLGHEIGLGIGIAQGYATLGRIGYEGRHDYAAIGTVTILAARLCAEAKHGQILIDSKVQIAIEKSIGTESCGALTLKGFYRPTRAYNVCSPTPSTARLSLANPEA